MEQKPCRALTSSQPGQLVEPSVETKSGEAAFCFYETNYQGLEILLDNGINGHFDSTNYIEPFTLAK